MSDQINELYAENVPLVPAEPARDRKTMDRRNFLRTVLGSIGAGAGLATLNAVSPIKLFAQDGGGYASDVGRVFNIDGVPDPSYSLRTPGECTYAFLDLMESLRTNPNNFEKLSGMLWNGAYGRLSKPVPPLSFMKEVALEKVRNDYPVLRQVQILRVSESSEADPGSFRVRASVNYNPDNWHAYLVHRNGDGTFHMAGTFIYTDARLQEFLK